MGMKALCGGGGLNVFESQSRRVVASIVPIVISGKRFILGKALALLDTVSSWSHISFVSSIP